jgi:hypothetical protein
VSVYWQVRGKEPGIVEETEAASRLVRFTCEHVKIWNAVDSEIELYMSTSVSLQYVLINYVNQNRGFV